MRDAPPTASQWRLDGELRGHSPQETLRYLSDCADFADELAARRSMPAQFVSPDCEPRPITWLRRQFGR
jgi:hypothetical protein